MSQLHKNEKVCVSVHAVVYASKCSGTVKAIGLESSTGSGDRDV